MGEPAGHGSGAGSGGTGGAGAAAGNGSSGMGAVSDGFDIHLDYQFDTTGEFSADRRAALEAAVHLWTDHITDEFEDVPAGTALRSRDPTDILSASQYFSIDYDIDDLVLMVGFGEIDGPGNVAAETGSAFTNYVEDAELLYTLEARFYQNPYQPWLASMGFDRTEEWFFDATPETSDDIPPYGIDFISIALHELGHALGIGRSDAFSALIVDGHFTGAKAVATYGGPVPLEADLLHLQTGTMSGGVECLMTPSTSAGERRLPTAVDLAILEDLGYHLR